MDKDGKIIRNQVGYEILGSKNIKQDDNEILHTSIKAIQEIKKTTQKLREKLLIFISTKNKNNNNSLV